MPDFAPDSPAAAGSAESPQPLIVDLGKHPRKAVKRLREGRGKLTTEIASCLDELKSTGTLPADAQPVVIVIREKRRKNALWPLA